MPFTGPLEDRLLIRELYDRHTDACWRCDRDDWLSCFAENVRWTTHLFDCSGKEEMREKQYGILQAWTNFLYCSATDLPAEQCRRPQHQRQRLSGHRPGIGADLPGRLGIRRRPPGTPGAAADPAPGRRRQAHRGAERGAGLGHAGRRQGRRRKHRAQIRANEIALEGVEREAIVGSRTTLDVLNATQALLTSRTTLVQNLSQLITASYGVAVAIGRLTARDLHLPVPLYDETAYYQAVQGSLGRPGRLRDQPAGPLTDEPNPRCIQPAASPAGNGPPTRRSVDGGDTRLHPPDPERGRARRRDAPATAPEDDVLMLDHVDDGARARRPAASR